MGNVYEEIMPNVSVKVDTSGIIRPAALTGRIPLVIGTACKGTPNEMVLIDRADQLDQVFGAADPYSGHAGKPLTLNRFAKEILNSGNALFCMRAVESTAKKFKGRVIMDVGTGTITTFMAIQALVAGEWYNYVKYKAEIDSDNIVTFSLLFPSEGEFDNQDVIQMQDNETRSYIQYQSSVAYIKADELEEAMTIETSSLLTNSSGWFSGYYKFTDHFEVISAVFTGDASVEETEDTGIYYWEALDPDTITLIEDEEQTSTDEYTVTVAETPVVDVEGVWLLADTGHSGTNYFASFIAATGVITTTELPSGAEAVIINYQHEEETLDAGLGTNWSVDDVAEVSATQVEALLEDSLLETIYYVMVAGANEQSTYFPKMLAHIQKALDQSKERMMLVGSSDQFSTEEDFMDNDSGFLADDDLGGLKGSNRVICVAGGYQTPNPYYDGLNHLDQYDILTGGYATAVICGCLLSRDWHEGVTNMPPSEAGYSLSGLEFRFRFNNRGKLVQNGCIVIEDRGTYAIPRYVVIDGVTLTAGTNAFHDINTRQIVDYIRMGMRGSSLAFIGKLNNPRVREALRNTLQRFLDRTSSRGFLTAYKDLTVTASRADEISGIANVAVSIQPVYILKFIKINVKVE